MKEKLKKLRKLLCVFVAATLIFQLEPCTMSDSKVCAKANSKNKAAMKAYEALLTSSKKAEKVLGNTSITQVTTSYCKFALIDLNKDGIKEMVLTTDDGYHSEVLAYVKGKVKVVGGGFSGNEKYYTSKHIYRTLTVHSGDYILSYYKFNGKKMKLVAEKHGSDYINMKTGKQKTGKEFETYAPYKYTVNGKTVSEKKYKSYVKKLLKGAKNKKLKWHKNTKSNRSKYLIGKN